MSHVRQQIREAVVAALTGLATTGSRVHASRLRPQGDAGLPCLLVTTESEEVVETSILGLQRRELVVQVRGYAKATGALDDTLDTIAAEVETALGADVTLGGLAKGSLLLAGIDIDFDDALDKPVGVVVLQFKAGYYTVAGAPGVLA
jgi:hypothetical protein